MKKFEILDADAWLEEYVPEESFMDDRLLSAFDCEIVADLINKNLDPKKIAKINEIKAPDTRAGELGTAIADAMKKAGIFYYRGEMYWFDGKIHRPFVEASFEPVMQILMEKSDINQGDGIAKFSMIKGKVSRLIVGTKAAVKIDRDYVSFKNCVLHIPTKRALTHSPRFGVFSLMPYDYDPYAECPMWKKFLNESVPDESVKKNLQEFLGILFLDRKKAKFEKMCCLLGEGRNGKGVVYSVVKAIVGEQNASDVDINRVTTKKSDEYTIASIDGKIVNYCSDISKTSITGDGFKNAVSGEPMDARFPYGRLFTAYNLPIMMVNANTLPATSDHSNGYYRRWHIIPFKNNVTVENEDPKLTSKLLTEISGIFNWILEGRERYIENGYKFTKSEAMEAALREYTQESDGIVSFLAEARYIGCPMYNTQRPEIYALRDLYTEFKTHCYSSGSFQFSSITFGKKLTSLGFEKRVVSNVWSWIVYKVPYEDDWQFHVDAGHTNLTKEEWSKMISKRAAPSGVVGFVEKSPPKPPVQLSIPPDDDDNAMPE